MTNYLSQLPDEIIDLILIKCADSYECHSDGFAAPFIRFEYIIDQPIRKIYHEYTGRMKNGAPNGTGIMYSGSSYVEHYDNVEHDNKIIHKISTIWLYCPFIYIIHNCNQHYKLRYYTL